MSNGSIFSPVKILNNLIYLSVLVVLWALLLKSPHLVLRLFSPAQVEQEEAVNLEFGRILALGHNLYPDIRQGGPYIHCSYPPLFPFLESRILNLTRNPWLPGRLLAFSGYLGCGLLLGIANWKKQGLSPWIILLPFLLWLSPTWASWGTMIRMDTLLLFLNFCSFLILVDLGEKWSGKIQWGHWLCAGLFNGAAILMKPTALTLTLSVVLWAVWKHHWKGLGLFVLSALEPVLIVTLAMQKATLGMYGFDTIRWAAVGFSWERFSYFVFHSFLKEAGWLVALVLLTGWFKPLGSLIKIQLVISLLSIWTLCRDGSAENYYMGFILYGLWAVGEGWATREKAVKGTDLPIWVRGAAGGLLLTGALLFFLSPGPYVPSQSEIKMKYSVLPIYARGEYHLALDEDLPVMAGKAIWYQPSGILSILKAGDWNPAPLVRDIEDHKFSTIEFYDLPHQYLYPPVVEQAVLKNYVAHWKAYGRVWYVPKKR